MASLHGLIAQLFQDALAVGRAELDLVKSKVMDKVRHSRTAIILFLAAAVIALAGLISLMTGFVLALVPLVGAAGAGAIVFVGALLVAGILGYLGSRQFSATPAPTEPSR